MNVYQLDHNGYFQGVTEADSDPKDPSNWLIPARCVLVEPPLVGVGEVAKWVNDRWTIVQDKRGTKFWLPDGTPMTITSLDQEIPTNASLTEPGSSFLDKMQQKLKEIEVAYNIEIQKPIDYLGTTFQADRKAQTKLINTLTIINTTSYIPPNFGWIDSNNNLVSVTTKELSDLVKLILDRDWNAFQKKIQLKTQVRNSNTIEQLGNIVW